MKALTIGNLLLVCTAYLACGGATHWPGFRSHVNWWIGMGYPDYARNEQDCMSFCLRDHYPCTAAVYNSINQQCYHASGRRPTILEIPSYSPDYGMITLHLNLNEIKGWLAAYSFYMDSNAVYTYGEAGGKCQIFGGRLMTQTEYETAYNEDEHMCNCGWLEGGVAMYASQYANYTTCTFQGIGIGFCNNTVAHALCVPQN